MVYSEQRETFDSGEIPIVSELSDTCRVSRDKSFLLQVRGTEVFLFLIQNKNKFFIFFTQFNTRVIG